MKTRNNGLVCTEFKVVPPNLCITLKSVQFQHDNGLVCTEFKVIPLNFCIILKSVHEIILSSLKSD